MSNSSWFFPESSTPVTANVRRPQEYPAVGYVAPAGSTPTTKVSPKYQAFGVANIPRQVQRQDSLSSQINDLVDAALRLGMYDAADWVRAKLGRK